MTRKSAEPVLRALSDEEIEGFLARNHVGRIAFSFHDSVDIRPVHYVFHDGWLFGRTSVGEKLETLRHNQWVAFEVDEVEGALDWESVVARGTFHHLSPEGTEYDLRLYERAATLIREVAPDAWTRKDPVAFRTELFGIAIDSVTGRSCTTKPAT